MKKKILAWAVLPLAAILTLAACGPATDTSTVDPAPTSSSEPIVPVESSPVDSTPESPDSQDSSNPDAVEHRVDFNKTVSTEAITRAYDDRFDTVIDDFVGSSTNGLTTGKLHQGKLRAVVDSNLDSFPGDAGAAIYKAAAGTYEAMNFGANGIGFRIRVVEGALSLSDLRLELRGGDAFETFPIQLAEAKNSDGEDLPELTGEFQDVLVNPGQSIDDEATVYKNLDGTDSETTVLGHILGFHLVANRSDLSAVIEIDEVFTYVGTTRTVLDDFNREVLNKVPDAWWGGNDSGAAILVRRGLNLHNTEYRTPELTGGDTHVVFSLLGDTSDVQVSGFDNTGHRLSTIAWSDLNAAAVDGAYGDYAIDISALEAEGKAVAKVGINASSEVEISKVFTTSFEEPVLNLEYPRFDVSSVVYFDSFDRDIASLNADWDASAALPANIDAGINGFVSYSMGDQISTSDSALHLPVAANYAEVTIGSQHVLEGADYVIFEMKSAGDLSNFRFQIGSGEWAYFSSCLAAEGVKTYNDPQIENPYVGPDYTLYVIDLAANNMAAGDLMNIYWTGEATLDIGGIFYGYRDSPMFVDGAGTIDQDQAAGGVVNTANYARAAYIENLSSPYIRLDVMGDGVATLETLRVEYNGDTIFANSGDKPLVCYIDGVRASSSDIIPSDCSILIDLVASGFTMGNGLAHIHLGGWGTGGTLTILSVFTMSEGCLIPAGAGAAETFDGSREYAYLGGFGMNFSYDLLGVTFSVSGGLTWETFRLQHGSDFFWANAGLVITKADGTVVDFHDAIESGVIYYINMAASGIETVAGNQTHLHFGAAGIEGTIQASEMFVVCSATPYIVILSDLYED